MILDYINQTIRRSNVKIKWVLKHLSLPVSTYYRRRRLGRSAELLEIRGEKVSKASEARCIENIRLMNQSNVKEQKSGGFTAALCARVSSPDCPYSHRSVKNIIIRSGACQGAKLRNYHFT